MKRATIIMLKDMNHKSMGAYKRHIVARESILYAAWVKINCIAHISNLFSFFFGEKNKRRYNLDWGAELRACILFLMTSKYLHRCMHHATRHGIWIVNRDM